MKFNENTSMEPHLLVEIQMLLSIITTNFWAQSNDTNPMSRLGGICTAIHAYTDEVWTPQWDAKMRYVLVNEDETECITPDEL